MNIKLHVNDLLITGRFTLKLVKPQVALITAFEMTNLGHLPYFLGMETYESHGRIHTYRIRSMQYALNTRMPSILLFLEHSEYIFYR